MSLSPRKLVATFDEVRGLIDLQRRERLGNPGLEATAGSVLLWFALEYEVRGLVALCVMCILSGDAVPVGSYGSIVLYSSVIYVQRMLHASLHRS